MKENLKKNTPKEAAKVISLRNFPKYIRIYASKCRESYYHMLSL